MSIEISAERLSNLVGSIYDCVITPEGWAVAIDAVRRDYGFAFGLLGINALRSELSPPTTGPIAIRACSGLAEEAVAHFESFSSEEVLDYWGGPATVSQHPLGEPIMHSQVTDRARLNRNRIYTQWSKPLGVSDVVVIALARERAAVGSLAFARHESAGEIGESEMSGLRLIAPHVRRAVTISRLFEFETIEPATFASVIETLATGVVLTDETLAIVHANAVAMAMLSDNDPISSRQGRLALSHKVGNGVLEAAVVQAASEEARLGERGIGIPARRANGSPCVLHVLPLRQGEIRRGLIQRAAAAVFIAPAASPPRLPIDALSILYDLTPAESRIFELICDGETQAEIAAKIGIASSTVKTHLLRVFEKTGCARQAELIKLAASFSVPYW